MNKVLQLKGSFESRSHPKAVVIKQLAKGQAVLDNEIRNLRLQLEEILAEWEKDTLIEGALLSVHYKRIIPKTKRMQSIIGGNGVEADDCIRGARFEDNDSSDKRFNKRHVFTYFIPLSALRKAIERLTICEQIVVRDYKGCITSEDISSINSQKRKFDGVSRSVFVGCIVDCSNILYFNIDRVSTDISEKSIISLFKTKRTCLDILRGIGINVTDARFIDECNVRLYRDEIELLQERAPYLIAMVNNLADICPVILPVEPSDEIMQIESPTNEPVVGVIDTYFDNRVYFHEWVDEHNYIDENIGAEPDDYLHGTEVTSIVVDGPRINPNLEDDCGRFQVRHFGIARARRTNSFEILKRIREIVISNPDIKVWNLSLGSPLEIEENSISPEAAILDKLQYEYDVIFVIAGTNDLKKTGKQRIGAPADSINAIVVNSVNGRGDAASYSRSGPVLGFFYKPDVSCFGGDNGEYIRVCAPYGEAYVSGTSFAAPWITRKLAFLINKMGLSREVAKALIIDSAAGWDRKDDATWKIGYGVVPKSIKSVLQTRDDEIRFVVSGTINEYETYNYRIPVPVVNNLHPYWSRATMAYFPYCNRAQGVDYTSTEIDLHFGRVYKQNDKTALKEINNNKQSSEELKSIYENDARLLYRKWDNVKFISEQIEAGSRPRKNYGAGMYGIRVVSKERSSDKKGIGLNFGIVVTLKEMNGVNRIDEFIKQCSMYAWLVTPIDIDAYLDLYNSADDVIEWE